MKICKIIPFRLSSSRFPEKPLRMVFGKTLIENALINAQKINWGNTILTCPESDYRRITEATDIRKRYAFDFVPTNESCGSATERIVELSSLIYADTYVSIPVDEPAIIPEEIEKCMDSFMEDESAALTLYCDFFCIEDAESMLSAKIVTGRNDEILYMSRQVIPIRKNGSTDIAALKKNVGVFFFKRNFLDTLRANRGIETSLDRLEGLEQLRWIELGLRIRAKKIIHFGFGIDVPEQIAMLEERIECLQTLKK